MLVYSVRFHYVIGARRNKADWLYSRRMRCIASEQRKRAAKVLPSFNDLCQ